MNRPGPEIFAKYNLQRLILMETDIREITKAVADEYGVSEAQIWGRGRKKAEADARQMTVYLIWRKCDCTIVSIGRMFGRSHPTICYTIRRIEDLLCVDRPTRRHYENLKNTLDPVSHALS